MGYDNDKSNHQNEERKICDCSLRLRVYILPASRRLDEVVIHLEGKHHLCREQQHRKALHPSSRTDATKNLLSGLTTHQLTVNAYNMSQPIHMRRKGGGQLYSRKSKLCRQREQCQFLTSSGLATPTWIPMWKAG
jgi:hypothetical protein